jgi:hypothetical protein
MGNDFSRKNSMFVQTQNPFYYSGDEVRGTVFVNVVEAFNCEGLNLAVCHLQSRCTSQACQISGQEYTHFTRTESESDGNNGTRTVTRHFTSTNKFFDVKVGSELSLHGDILTLHR